MHWTDLYPKFVSITIRCNSSIFLFFYFNPHHFRTQQKLLKAISNHGKFTNQSMHKKFTDQSIHKCKSTTLSLVCIITSPTVTLLISGIVSIFLFSRFWKQETMFKNYTELRDCSLHYNVWSCMLSICQYVTLCIERIEHYLSILYAIL